jgi:hypothetical protein
VGLMQEMRMIDEIRNNHALMVVRPSNETAVAGNLAGRLGTPDSAVSLVFLGEREPEPQVFREKGSMIDCYA